MPTKYAEGTSVSIARSRDEIERLLARHQATGFLYGEQGSRAMIAFELGGRRYRMELKYPRLSDVEGHRNQYTRRKSDADLRRDAWEAEKQRLWRGLVLLVKGKLEAVASGIATIESELLAYTVMPDGETVGEWLSPQIAEMYKTGQMPPLLPGANHRKQLGSGVIEGEVV